MLDVPVHCHWIASSTTFRCESYAPNSPIAVGIAVGIGRGTGHAGEVEC